MQFKDLCDILSKIEPITSRIEIRDILKEFLKSAESKDVDKIIYLLQSEFFRTYEGIELNIGNNIFEDIIAKAYGFSREDVEKHHLKSGDLGITAEYFANQKKQKALFTHKLTVEEVYLKLREVAKTTGKSSTDVKTKLLSAVLQNADPIEAKYIVKIVLGTLRISLGIQTIIEAVALTELEKQGVTNYKEDMPQFKEIKEKIERKYNINNDLGLIVKTILFEGFSALDKINVVVGIPLKSALAEREKSPEAIIERMGKCIVEGKYDGFRLQVHHKKGFTKIFSRRAEDLTNMFPEFVEILRNVDTDFIFDSEAIGYNKTTGKYLNFQETIKRKRKYDVAETAQSIPIILHIFDVLYYDSKAIMDLPMLERRRLVEMIVQKIGSIHVRATNAIITDNPKDMYTFFKHSVDTGLEGIIAKDLNKQYVPGNRDFAWIKLKKNYMEGQFDSIDLAVVGYFLGKGKYANKPSSLLCAVYDSNANVYKVVAKVASGLTEDLIDYFDDEFKNLVLDKKPANYLSALEPYHYLKAHFVIEVLYDEITKSPLYRDTGEAFSLRFPRIIQIRDDRSTEETTTEEELKRLFDLQKNK